MALSTLRGQFQLGCVIVLFFLFTFSFAAISSQMTAEGGELLSFFTAEEQRGSVLTYTQSYTDDENERVSYAGTLYAGIHLFKLDQCQMLVRVAVEDRYSGKIGHRGLGRIHFEPTGELTDDTLYEYRVALGDVSAQGVHGLRAVPAELNGNTTVRCEEDRFCNLDWIQITAHAASISETKTVNGFQNVEKKVISIVLPIASQDQANQGTRLLSAASSACSANGGASK